jgi:iron complex transport system ATP-binding protein
MSEQNMIKISGLSFRYNGNGRTIFDKLSLQIPEASVTAILGPNGSGKSTLLLILVGVLPPNAGQILINGKQRQHYPRMEINRLVGLVPQDEQFPLGLSALDYVLLGRAPHLGLLEQPGNDDYDMAREALELTGLASLRDRPIALLSGGERQLVTMARALAQRPRILLLDEPTSHLDLGNTKHILQLLRHLTEENVTIVFTTHDPAAAAAVADHVALLSEGQILATGTAEIVMTSQNLSNTYGIPVKVIQIDGKPFVLAF